MLGQTGLDTFPRFIQAPIPLEPRRQTQARVDRRRVRRHRALEAGAGLFQAAQAMILLADGNEQIGISGGQFRCALRGLIGQREIQIASRRQAQFGPQLRNARELFDQIAVAGQGGSMTAIQQILLRMLPGSHDVRRSL